MTGQGWWLPPGEQPTAAGGDGGQSNEDEKQVEHRHLAHPFVDLTSEESGCVEIGGGRAEHGAQHGEGAGRGSRECAARPSVRPDRCEDAHVACSFAPDQTHGHRQHTESQQDAGCGRIVAKLGERRIVVLRFNRHADRDRGLSDCVDLQGSERPRGLDQPRSEAHLQLELVHGESRDEEVEV